MDQRIVNQRIIALDINGEPRLLKDWGVCFYSEHNSKFTYCGRCLSQSEFNVILYFGGSQQSSVYVCYECGKILCHPASEVVFDAQTTFEILVKANLISPEKFPYELWECEYSEGRTIKRILCWQYHFEMLSQSYLNKIFECDEYCLGIISLEKPLDGTILANDVKLTKKVM